MTDYPNTDLFIDEDFSWNDDWDESLQTFSFGGVHYKVGVNAFTEFSDAVASKATGTARMVIGYPVSEMGDYDHAAPVAWDGTLVISTADDSPSEQAAWCIDGALVIDSAGEFTFGVMEQSGSFHITNGSIATLTYHLGALFNHFTNLVIDGGSRLRDSGRLGAGFTLSGTSAIYGSGEGYDVLPSLSSVKESILAADSSLLLSQGATAQFGLFTQEQGSTVQLESSALTISKTLTLHNGSTLTLDASSFLKVCGNTVNDGSIIVDATGFIGYRKVIDLSGITHAENTATVINAADNLTVLNLEDGDVILTTADMSKLKVNAHWNGNYQLGDALDPSGDFIYGVNAHDSYEAAYAIATPRIPRQTIIIDADCAVMAQDNTLTDIAVENSATLEIASDVSFGKTTPDDAFFLIQAGGALAGSAKLALQGNACLTLSGEEENCAMVDMTSSTGDSGDILLEDAAALNATSGTLVFGALLLDSNSTAVTMTDSDLTLSSALRIGSATKSAHHADVLFDNTDITLNSIGTSDNYGNLALKNASNLIVTFDNSEENTFANYGTMELSGESFFMSSRDLLNDGTITLDNASITTDRNTANNGTIKATGATLTTHGTLNNTQSLQLDQSTITVDTELNSSSSFLLKNSQASINQLNLKSGSFTATDSTLNITQSLDNHSSMSLTDTQTTITLDLINRSTLTMQNGTLSILGNLTNNQSLKTTGGSLTVGNALENKGILTLTGTAVTISGNMNATHGTITVTDSQFTINGNATSSGNIILRNSSLTTSETFTNNGLITIDGRTPLQCGAFSGATGKISMDLSAETADIVKIIDTTGSAALSLDSVGTVSLNNKKYSLLIYDNDLYAFNKSIIKINSTWTEDSTLPVGYIWGINAFRDIGNASRTIPGGTITYEYTYSNKEDCDVTGFFTITPTAGTPTATFKHGDVLLATTSVTSAQTQTIDMISGETYRIEITGDNALYSISASFMGNNENPKQDLDYTISDSGTTGYAIAPAEFLFEVPKETSGDFTVTISDVTKRVSYKVVNKDTGKSICSGSTTDIAGRSMSLTEGQYALIISAYSNTSHRYDTDYSIYISGTLNADVRSQDDSWIVNDKNGDLQTLSLAHNVDGFVGLGDKTDYIHVDFGQETGLYSFYLETEEDTDTNGLRFYLICVSDSSETTIASATYTTNKSTPMFSNIMMDGTNNYFLRVSAPIATSSSYNATYTIKMQKGEENLNVSKDDDNWTNAAVHDEPYTGGTHRDWLGTEDTVDWVRIAPNTYTGTHTISFTADGYRMFCVISQNKSGVLQTITSMNAYDGGAQYSTDINFAANTEYYIKMSVGSTDDISCHYTMCIA